MVGKLKQFLIILDRDTYLSGTTLVGRVVIQLSEPMKMRGIHVELSGYANVNFYQRERRGSDGYEEKRYHASEQYHSNSLALFGKKKGKILGNNPQMPAGHHEYPFHILLPPHLPPSAELQHGDIRHQVKATIERPWKNDHVIVRPITVLGLLDLNAIQLVPFSASKDKTLGCLCWASGDISMDIKLPRTAYVPGEYIIFNGVMTNNSSRKIDSYSMRIKQYVLYRAKYPEHATQSEHRVVAHQKRGQGIEPGGITSLETEALLVPPLLPSALGACKIIDVSYTLEIEMEPSGASYDLMMTIPLTIGTIPPHQMGAVSAPSPYNPYWNNPHVPPESPPPYSLTP